MDTDEPTIFDPFGLGAGANIFDRNARCNSQPTSDIMLALRKYGVTSRKNLTVSIVNEERERKKDEKMDKADSKRGIGMRQCAVLNIATKLAPYHPTKQKKRRFSLWCLPRE